MHLAPPPSFPDLATFPDLLDGLPGIRLATDTTGQAFIAAQGAQVLSWRASDGRERLYLSATTGGLRHAGEKAAAIRGGIPVCLPQFSDRGPLVKHGFARNLPWTLVKHDANTLVLTLRDDQASLAQWPHPFLATVTVLQGPDSLEVRLSIANTGNQPFAFSTALHTYLRVDDIRNIRLLGLQGVSYQDATDHCVVKTQQEAQLPIPGEVDRVYMAPPASLQLIEQGRAPLQISQQGFSDTVVWNPGPDKAHSLPDMPDQDWQHMLCVEAACAAAPVTLPAGAIWQGSQRLSLA
ncbi:D-hexose-6-phosphate mutarotase [Noviherbaspirillum soli]|uniref:D-hexose-6-phosphate mutarotase n=1 Tax=Noviherbaspirillum soli TaxID=1064518 RepID=UPI00188A7807|nr:D-hexose-6-phosphate mutarotase [Noviherbaspirillum soli]